MRFTFKLVINRRRQEVFDFFKNLHELPFEENKLVPVYDKITPGPVGAGTKIREVVNRQDGRQMVVISEITHFNEPFELFYKWESGKMRGILEYRLSEAPDGTVLDYRQTLVLPGLLKLANPLIYLVFRKMLRFRVNFIKEALDAHREKPSDIFR